MTQVPADDLDAAAACLAEALNPATSEDWTSAPGTGDLTAWQTAEHIGDCLLSYAAQLASGRPSGFVPFLATLEKDTSPADALQFARTAAAILAAVVRSSPAESRAYHPTGTSDPAGFAAMGCAEVLVHGEDMARGLGVKLNPPPEICTRTLARLFPHLGDVSDLDPWTALLWAMDRRELPNRPSQSGWRWQGEP
ncbi:DinB family protein [Amycolatopsis sp. NPDC004378]